MSQSSSSVDSLTRPRVAVAVATAILALSAGYYSLYVRGTAFADVSSHQLVAEVPGGGLHRSNAVRRRRRSRGDDAHSISSAEAHGDENAQADADANGDAAATADAEDPANHTSQAQQPGDEGETAGAGEWFNDQAVLPAAQRAGHNIVNLLFRVSEDNARRNGCVHRGCQCNSCGVVPIRGIRYRCANCADFDLCETCEASGMHVKTHVFFKVKVPAPPFGPRQMQSVWYTGDPDTCRRNLPRGLMAKLSRETGFERPELENFWEQWTFMANTEWREDPDELCIAMDRKTFDRCLVPTGGSRHAAPNLIHDRMFAFYDSNKDDLIGFTEFLHGLSYRKRKDKLRRVFDGYDIDGDKFVNRRDFLRMFRAYYVLYKQMHKDILDGLDDQLIASTEARQLVTSRQPLSSLFGREGRVPTALHGLRYEGKTYGPDGSVEVAPGFEHAVAPDLPDTANRADILTSLFAYADPALLRAPGDSNWRSVRPPDGNEADRAYWAALLEPPASLEELPRVLTNNQGTDTDGDDDDGDYEDDDEEENDDGDDEEDVEAEDDDEGEQEDQDDDDEDQDHEDEEEDGGAEEDGEDGEDAEAGEDEGQDEEADDEQESLDENADSDSNPFAAGRAMNESEIRASYISHIRTLAPKLEKKRRDMARWQLHERWKRRQFYLDEEEGGEAPDDWEEDEDVFLSTEVGESSNMAHQRSSARSRSNSKVRFAEKADDGETRSNASSSSRGLPERRVGIEVTRAERDGGKEILYQVTQQAFNELLDTIFKAAEDIATEAAETLAMRERFKEAIDALDSDGEGKSRDDAEPKEDGGAMPSEKPIQEKTLKELLADSGYTVEPQEESQVEAREEPQAEPRNAVEIDASIQGALMEEEEETKETPAKEAEMETETTDSVEEYRDPTLPQFRPNSEDSSLSTPIPKSASSRSLSPSSSRNTSPTSVDGGKKEQDENAATATLATSASGLSEFEPTVEMLRRWKELNIAEEEAARRGGWGRLSFEEFEEIYKRQEHQGNRLDYLGSWIDFCIP